MIDLSYPFRVYRDSYTVVTIFNLADADKLAVEIGVPNDPTGCDPTKMLWTAAKRCGAHGVVTNSEVPLVFDVPGNYRLVWQTDPNPDIIVAVDEATQGGKRLVQPQAT